MAGVNTVPPGPPCKFGDDRPLGRLSTSSVAKLGDASQLGSKGPGLVWLGEAPQAPLACSGVLSSRAYLK